MNIWIINQAAGKPGLGWGERHYLLAKEFVKEGHQVTIFSSSSNHLFDKEAADKLPKVEIVDNVIFVWLRTTPYYKSKSIKRIIGWFVFIFKLTLNIGFKVDKKPDKIIVSSSPLTPIVSGIIFKFRYKAELILEIRDFWPSSLKQLGNYSKNNFLILFLTYLERIAYTRSDKIVGVMKYGDLHIKNTIKLNKPYYWIPNGFGLLKSKEISSYSREVVNEIDAIRNNHKIIGYIGTFGIANNLDRILELSRFLPEYYFVLIGDGPEKESIFNRIKEESLENVKVFRKVEKEQLPHIMPSIDFGIIAWKDLEIYQYGVSANKYFDYMYFGIPVISLGSVKGDPVELYHCGLKLNELIPDEAKKIKEYIRTVNYQNESENGKFYVNKYHSFATLAANYLKVLGDE